MKFVRLLTLLFAISLLSCKPEKPIKERPNEPLAERVQSDIAFFRASSGLLKSGNFQNLVFQPFQNPPEIVAKDGRLDTVLNIAYATNKLYNTVQKKNITLFHRSYNQGLVGPTLRIKPGDSLLVLLNNKLPNYNTSDIADCTPFIPHNIGSDPNIIDTLRFNLTNLHTHGLHVSPMGHSDNIFVTLSPDCSFQNRIGVPTNQAPGTFWYHAHFHGSTAIQVSSGMAGSILIEGGVDTTALFRSMDEKIFVLEQMPYTPDTINANDPNKYAIKFIEGKTFGPGSWEQGIKDSTGWRTTINGQTIPVITIGDKEVQRWRFVHAGVRETVNLKLAKLKDQSTLEYQTMYAIAQDGITYGYRDDVDSMLLQPGYRADLLIQHTLKAGQTTDTLYLIDDDSPTLDNSGGNYTKESEKLLAVVVVTKKTPATAATELPSDEMLAPYAPYPSLMDKPVTDSMQYVKFNIIPGDTTLFQINGVAFNHLDTPRSLTLNRIQEWTLTSGLASHPFHIHVNHFQLKEKWHKNKTTGKLTKIPIRPIWKDTYYVENNKEYMDSIIIKTVYKDFIGDFVIHCHILDHEDQGMMQCVRIDSANTIRQFLLDREIQFCGPQYTNSLTSLN